MSDAKLKRAGATVFMSIVNHASAGKVRPGYIDAAVKISECLSQTGNSGLDAAVKIYECLK